MGTPVAAALKRTYKDARLIYLAHESLFPLLELTRCIDGFLPFEKEDSIFRQASLVKQQNPQLVIDLVGSLRTKLITMLVGARTCTLNKRRDIRRGLHVVDSYLQTVSDLQLDLSAPPFPSLFPTETLVQELKDGEGVLDGVPLVVLVPGVGHLRPNRAWTADGWCHLGRELIARYNVKLALVGGADDMAVCSKLEAQLGGNCVNLAGRLTLPVTAALLSKADFVLSADTGPAHIAVAVGAKVICLTGPTDPYRTGPYGMQAIGMHVGGNCSCHQAKHCTFTGTAPGRCMQAISAPEVLVLVERLLSQRGQDKAHSRPGNSERSRGS
jgi:ADP-heptose:LPS heptosyltransferase